MRSTGRPAVTIGGDPDAETLSVFRHGSEGYIDLVNASVGDVIRAEPFDAIELHVGEIFGHERE